jgi:hypothetical protein
MLCQAAAVKTTTRSVVAVAALLFAGALVSPAAPKAHPDTIWTKKAYANFILDLEFKVAKESNSGVFLRAGNIKDVLSALEIQVYENPDGTKNKFAKALKDFARKGALGLQGLHGKAQAPVWYRNLKIKELK